MNRETDKLLKCTLVGVNLWRKTIREIPTRRLVRLKCHAASTIECTLCSYMLVYKRGDDNQ